MSGPRSNLNFAAKLYRGGGYSLGLPVIGYLETSWHSNVQVVEAPNHNPQKNLVLKTNLCFVASVF